MVRLVRRASLLVQFIFDFVRYNIVQKAGSWIKRHTQEKTKVIELKKKISTADEDDFFDICSAPEDQEQSSAFSRFKAAGKGESRANSYIKKQEKKKKRVGFRSNKVAPMEKLAWKDNKETNGEGKGKTNAASLFTSRSAKAFNARSSFDKPCHQSKSDREFLEESNSPHSSGKEKTTFERLGVDTRFQGQDVVQIQTGGNRNNEELAKPGPSSRTCDELDNNFNCASLKQETRLDPSPGRRSRISFKWKSSRSKKGTKDKAGLSVQESENNTHGHINVKKTGHSSSSKSSKISLKWRRIRDKEGKTAKAALPVQESENNTHGHINVEETGNLSSSKRSKISFKWKGFKKRGGSENSKLPTPQYSGKSNDATCSSIKLTTKQLDQPSDSRSRLTFSCNAFPGRKGRKKKRTLGGTGELHPGFQHLKDSLDRQNSLRSRISFKWNRLMGKKGKQAVRADQATEGTGVAWGSTSYPSGEELPVEKGVDSIRTQSTLNKATEDKKVDKDSRNGKEKTSKLSKLLSRFKH